MTGTLDVSILPHDQQLVNDDKSVIDMRTFIEQARPAIEALMNTGLITKTSCLGVAFTMPLIFDQHEDTEKAWDDPSTFVWFVGGWGDDPNKLTEHQANAVRMLRPLLRERYESTLLMRDDHPQAFRDKVGAVEVDGTFLWGDYPRGGAVCEDVFSAYICCAVSGLSEAEDHAVALMLAGLLGKLFAEANNFLEH